MNPGRGAADYGAENKQPSTITPLSDTSYTASKIREFFNAAKRIQHNGKPYRPSQKFNRPEFWKTAAEICIELKADPYDLIRAAFLYNTTSGGPYPNQLCGNAVRRWYKNYQDFHKTAQGENIYDQEIQDMIVGAYRRAMATCASNRRKIKEYFLNEFLREDEVPAFIRLVLMPNDVDIYNRWSRIAYGEIMSNPKLLSVLDKKGYNLSFLKRVEEDARRL